MKILLLIYLFVISLSSLCNGIVEFDYEHIEARNLSDRDPDRINLDDLRHDALIISAKIKLYDQNSAAWPKKYLITELAEFSQKRMDPEYLFNKFSRDASNLDFSNVKYVSKTIMSRGSNALKKSFLNLLYKYKEKSILCSFELGKILLSGQAGVWKPEEGLMIIEKSAQKGVEGAIDVLIKYYSITKNQEKEFYYLEKAATKGKVYEKFVYYCIEKKLFDKARKYFTLYIQDLKDKIHDLEDGPKGDVPRKFIYTE